MKYTLENFFNELDPNELDEIMPDNFDGKLPKRALWRIEKAALQASEVKSNKRRFNFRIFAPIAACLVLTACVGGFAIAAEAKEYNAAVDFFAQNGLSAEGLSREELKAVYRDISTNRFVNDKTVEVIKRSVPGVEILQEEPTPEELATLWNSNINAYNGLNPKTVVEYDWYLEYQPGAKSDEWDKIILECLCGGETLWKTEFPTLGKKWGDDEFYVEDGIMTSAGSAVWGQRTHWTVVTEHSKSQTLDYSWLARIDNGGNKLWQIELDHGFEHEYIKAVLDNGDGYLVQTGGDANLVKLDHNGNIIDTFVYESDDCNYYITDMTEFEGNVYLSAYVVPKNNDMYRDGLFEIVDNIISEKDGLDVSPEELTPAVREHYTAVLLLCDPDGGEPKTFYSAKSSLGGTLSVEDNQLKWNVENIISVSYFPYISSFPISGKCLVYRYSFDENGALAGCEDTQKVVGFLR